MGPSTTARLEARARRKTAARSVVGGREAVALMASDQLLVLMIDANGTLWTQRLLGVLTLVRAGPRPGA